MYDKQTITFDEETIQLCPQIQVLNSLVKYGIIYNNRYESRIDQMIKNKRVDL